MWRQKISVRILEKCERAAPLPLGPAAHIYQQSSFTPSPNRYRLKNSHNLVRPYVFIKMNNQDEDAPPPGARSPEPRILQRRSLRHINIQTISGP